MKTLKVKQLIEMLQAFNPEANAFMTSGVGEISDILSVDQPTDETVVVKCDENIFRRSAAKVEERKQMFKVLFSYKEDSPSGGHSAFTGLRKELKFYDAENAEELQSLIDAFRSDNKCGYRTNIRIVEVTKL